MTEEAVPTLLELAIRVHRGELAPEEAAQILLRHEGRNAAEPSA